MTFAVIGGDMRQSELAKALESDGHSVLRLGLDKLEECVYRERALSAQYIILPLPLEGDTGKLFAPLSKKEIPIQELLDGLLSPRQKLFGGRVSAQVREAFKARGFEIIDYFDNEQLTLKNANITAEAAVSIAMGETKETIFNAKCLITGFGRIAKFLARDLAALGAQVTIAARNPQDRAMAELLEYRAVPICDLAKGIAESAIVFNTVPYIIFKEEQLERAKKSCVYIELASSPGGIDMDAAQRSGIRLITAAALPGKYAPKSAAEAIKNTVYSILEERGEEI